MHRVVLLLPIVVGCGRLGFDLESGFDMPVDTPHAIASISDPSATEGYATVSPDLRELYFMSNRGGTDQIWLATRAAATDAWGSPEPVAELASSGSEESADLSSDGLTLWLASNRPGGLGGNDIYVATRLHLGDHWSTPVHVAELSSPDDDASCAPDASGLRVVFHSKRAGGQGHRDLWTATRASTSSKWEPPVALAYVNTPYEDADPFFTDDGLHLVFDSDRDTHDNREIFIASRSTPTALFDTPVPFPGVGSAGADADPWISADGLYMVFTSSRTGDDEIFEVHLAPRR